MKKTTITTNNITRTTLGVIKSETNGTPIEHSVEIGETTFRMLLSVLPKIDTHNAMNNELQSIKDLCTTLQMKPDLKRQDIVDTLTSAINYTVFMKDLAEFHKPEIKIVGKIDLNNI